MLQVEIGTGTTNNAPDSWLIAIAIYGTRSFEASKQLSILSFGTDDQ